MRSVIAGILVLFIVTAIVADTTVQCSLCGNPIKGSYTKFEDGSIFYMDCMQKYPHCLVCGKPSMVTITVDGKVICRDCLTELDRCSFCGAPLAGNYLIYPEASLKLCNDCAEKIPRCELCGVPNENLIAAGGKRICRSCYEKSEFCYICGTPIVGEYLWFDSDSTEKFCPTCVDKYPKCSSCGAPSGNYSSTLDDGRILCRDCYNAGYFDPQKVKEFKEQILTFLEVKFNMAISHNIKYSLQGADFIRTQLDSLSGDLSGLFYCHNNIYEIFVLYGLRQRDLYQVVAHEIAHAWATENCRKDLTLEDSEGFAQWIAYHSLRNFGYQDYSVTLTTGDNVYGRGLRKMLEIENNGGAEAVFKSLK